MMKPDKYIEGRVPDNGGLTVSHFQKRVEAG